ncbi:phosphoglycolate phosphatase [Halanaeroarchaeum sulfurireducens]|uniref:Phosphoglycolate phosphatase n=1 Tax=Halanaeroarchaeum sulfurireducens TaxID=1604004 RepID=A0A0F7PC08_9EURY|nr:phosphoglycolate phosphatase [Halanaeroarchaeum sulfurireducens]AKH97680.1 phosphoglycolate phosphatase [Halanaeroarchaeum sulfurireducens]
MVPPLAVDIDGTLSRADRSIDPRVLDALREWDAPVVIATGKALPFPVALCQFVGIPERVIAENGGISVVDDELLVHGDRDAADAVVRDYEEAGFDLGWGELDLANRWRETEIAVSHDAPLDPLSAIADDHGLEVVDTGFAYHVKSPTVSKGTALTDVAETLGVPPSSFVAIGDSENDVGMLERAGESFAVANADELARRAAETVTEGEYADGFLEAIDAIRR